MKLATPDAYASLPDDQNPCLLLATASTYLLASMILAPPHQVEWLLRLTLAARGCDHLGNQVGFATAEAQLLDWVKQVEGNKLRTITPR